MSSTTPADLKRRALEQKRAGNVTEVLQLLRQAKQLEAEQQQPTNNNNNKPPPDAVVADQKEQAEDPANRTEADDDAVVPEQDENDAIGEEEEANADDCGDAAALVDLMDDSCDTKPVTFTDEEMQQEEMMTEFRLGGMTTPSQEEYAARILAVKRTALQFKQAGDTAAAVAQLAVARQLEHVRAVLQKLDSSELEDDDGGVAGAETTSMALDLDECINMSLQELMDAVEMGFALPSHPHVLQEASKKKTAAVHFKQQGDLEGAKTALVEFKKLQQAAQTIQSIMESRQRASNVEQFSMEALEDLLLDQGNADAKTIPKQQQLPNKTADPVEQARLVALASKTAEELKQEAVRLRNEGNLKEATTVLKMYKEALQREAEAAEKKQCQELVESIQKEIMLAKKQERMFMFYERCVDPTIGASQSTGWKDYQRKCEQAVQLIESKGSKSLTISSKSTPLLKSIPEDQLVDFIECGTDTSDDRLEVTVLDISNLQDNKILHRLLAKDDKDQLKSCHLLRVQVTIQIPQSEEEREKPVELVFESPLPTMEAASPMLRFETSHYVNVPRGDSKFSETVRRRMQTRRIQICVYHTTAQKTKGWLWSNGSSSAPLEEPTLLGKIVLELNDLLKRNCIAGDYELLSGRRASGGTIGLVLRTGVPFDAQQLEASKEKATMAPYAAMSFSVPIEK